MSRLTLPILLLAVLLLLALAAAAYALLAGPIGRVGPEPGPALSVHEMPDVIRAQRLELVTPEGKVWADMGMGRDGSRGLRLYDDQGRRRVELVLRQGGAGLYVYDEGVPRPTGTLAPSRLPAPQGGLSASGGS